MPTINLATITPVPGIAMPPLRPLIRMTTRTPLRGWLVCRTAVHGWPVQHLRGCGLVNHTGRRGLVHHPGWWRRKINRSGWRQYDRGRGYMRMGMAVNLAINRWINRTRGHHHLRLHDERVCTTHLRQAHGQTAPHHQPAAPHAEQMIGHANFSKNEDATLAPAHLAFQVACRCTASGWQSCRIVSGRPRECALASPKINRYERPHPQNP